MIVINNLKTLHSQKKLLKRVIEIALFAVFYFVTFNYLEKVNSDINEVYNIHSAVDDMIPFVPAFIIPYILWFPYMAISVLYFGVMDIEGADYKRMTRTLAFGCVIFLFVSWVFPNGQNLRPSADSLGNSIFDKMIKNLYTGDTCTNVFPSLHVYNSICACGAWIHSKTLQGKTPGKTAIKVGLIILSWSIVLSTMFCKQHSFIDAVGGIVLYGICCIILKIKTSKDGLKG